MLGRLRLAWTALSALSLALAWDSQAEEGPASPAGHRANPMIHSEGMRLVDGAGRPIVLKGVDIEGWLQWAGHIWGCGFHSESTMMERLTQVAGPKETDSFRSMVYSHFVTEKDVARISSAGFNVIRLMINHRLLDAEGDEEGWKIIDRTLDSCQRHGVFVVLDLHSVPGGQSKLFVADPDGGPTLWESQAKRAQTAALWRKIAGRYKDRKAVAGYDLLNEPDPPNGEALTGIYKELIGAIREVDPNHMVILEGASFARDFSMFQGPLDSNQAYSFHLYNWFGDDRQKWLDKIGAIARRHGVPLWCGEWGENTYAMVKSTREMFERPESSVYGGWCYWVWKRAPTSYPPLIGIAPGAKWKELCAWLNHPLFHRKPSPADALAGMKEFIDSVDLDACSENKEMMRILTEK